MNKKRLFLPILLLIIFFSFNGNVAAKEEIGSCDYVKTGGSGAESFKVKIYDNGTLSITENNVYQDISDAYQIQMINYGRCFPIALLKKGGGFTKNTMFFQESLPSDTKEYAAIYVLDANKKNKERICYYDVRIDTKNQDYNSKYARLKLSIAENGSRFFYSFMDKDKSFPRQVNVSDYIYGLWFYGEKGKDKPGVVRYDLNNSGSIMAKIFTNSTYSELLNILRQDKCPTGNELGIGISYSYEYVILDLKYNGDEMYEIPSLQSDISFEEQSYVGGGAPSDVPTQGGTPSGTVQTQEGASYNPPVEVNECILNGVFSRKDSGAEADKFPFNFKYQVFPSTEPYFGIQMGGNYRYSSLSNNHVLANDVYTDLHLNMHFSLAQDLLSYIRTLRYNSGTECLTTVYITYKGEEAGESYEISLNRQDGSAALQEGEIAEPQTPEMHSQEYTITGKKLPDYVEGTTVSGCEILGDKFLSYLRSVLFWMQIFVPIIALVLSMVDLVKAIAAEDEDAKKKAIKATKTRIICSVIILLLPYLIEVILLLADRSEGHACVQAFMNSKGN